MLFSVLNLITEIQYEDNESIFSMVDLNLRAAIASIMKLRDSYVLFRLTDFFLVFIYFLLHVNYAAAKFDPHGEETFFLHTRQKLLHFLPG